MNIITFRLEDNSSKSDILIDVDKISFLVIEEGKEGLDKIGNDFGLERVYSDYTKLRMIVDGKLIEYSSFNGLSADKIKELYNTITNKIYEVNGIVDEEKQTLPENTVENLSEIF